VVMVLLVGCSGLWWRQRNEVVSTLRLHLSGNPGAQIDIAGQLSWILEEEEGVRNDAAF
jgi:hypothetical protein